MCGVTGTENVTPSAAAAAATSQSSPDRSVRHFPNPRFLCPACSFYCTRRSWGLWLPSSALADVPGGRRAEPTGESADQRCVTAAFLSAASRVASCANGYRGVSEKSPASAPDFINARTGVPQCGQQHFAAQIRQWSRALTSGASRYFGVHHEPSTSGGVPAPDNRWQRELSIGHGGSVQVVLHISVAPRGNVGRVFHSPVLFPDNGAGYRHASRRQQTLHSLFFEVSDPLLTQRNGSEAAHAAVLSPVPAHRGHAVSLTDDDVSATSPE